MRMDRVTWACRQCGSQIEDNEGSVRIAPYLVLRRKAAVRKWEYDHADPETGAISATAAQVVAAHPPRVHWEIVHYVCEEAEAPYDFDVSQLRTAWDLLRATAHLMESKNWLDDTNWHGILYAKLNERSKTLGPL